MAFMRKAAVYLGLVEDGEEQYDEYDEYDAPAPAQPGRRAGTSHDLSSAHDTRFADTRADVDYGRRGPRGHDGRAYAEPTGGRAGLATAVAPVPAPAPSRLGWGEPGSIRVTTLHPRTYNEARAIGEHFREGTPVIMNLTEMDDADAKRLVDFAAGLIFGLRGSIDRVTAKVFLLSPSNVEVTAEDKQRLAEGGFFNQS
jgi:cell division inhibitor SepF